jgi:hypothetical protein
MIRSNRCNEQRLRAMHTCITMMSPPSWSIKCRWRGRWDPQHNGVVHMVEIFCRRGFAYARRVLGRREGSRDWVAARVGVFCPLRPSSLYRPGVWPTSPFPSSKKGAMTKEKTPPMSYHLGSGNMDHGAMAPWPKWVGVPLHRPMWSPLIGGPRYITLPNLLLTSLYYKENSELFENPENTLP